jgi:hypothetical protein
MSSFTYGVKKIISERPLSLIEGNRFPEKEFISWASLISFFSISELVST